MQTITLSHHRSLAAFQLPSGVNLLDPSLGQPPAQSFEAEMQWHCLAFTPTTGTVELGGAGQMLVSGAALRSESQYAVAEPTAANLRHLRVWARRKPGTSNTIAAQVVRFGGTSSGSLVEMGRISIATAAAGEDPVSDVFDQAYLNGHANFTATDDNPFFIVTGSTDPDVEIVVEIFAVAS